MFTALPTSPPSLWHLGAAKFSWEHAPTSPPPHPVFSTALCFWSCSIFWVAYRDFDRIGCSQRLFQPLRLRDYFFPRFICPDSVSPVDLMLKSKIKGGESCKAQIPAPILEGYIISSFQHGNNPLFLCPIPNYVQKKEKTFGVLQQPHPFAVPTSLWHPLTPSGLAQHHFLTENPPHSTHPSPQSCFPFLILHLGLRENSCQSLTSLSSSHTWDWGETPAEA